MRDGRLVQDVPAKETSIPEVTRWMVGRSVDNAAAKSSRADADEDADKEIIMSIRNLWVDMPG